MSIQVTWQAQKGWKSAVLLVDQLTIAEVTLS